MYKPTKKEKDEKLIQAIDLLNEIVKVYLAPSPIHGVGVFALRDIKKGETIYADIIPHQFDIPYKKFKKLRKEIREIMLSHFPLVLQGSHFLYPVTKMTAYLNHSETPNYDAKTDQALRDIKKGEELTEDYRRIPGYEQVWKWLDRL